MNFFVEKHPIFNQRAAVIHMPYNTYTQFCFLPDSSQKTIDSHWFKIFCLSCLIFSCVYFFHKMMKFYKEICFVWINRTSAENFFLTDWRHIPRKNKIEISSIYWNVFPWISWIFKNCITKFTATIEAQNWRILLEWSLLLQWNRSGMFQMNIYIYRYLFL